MTAGYPDGDSVPTALRLVQGTEIEKVRSIIVYLDFALGNG